MMTYLTLTPRDPIVARDGRPFGDGQGNRMRSTGWPLPGVVAGSFRTMLAKECDQRFEPDVQERLLQIAVAGVLPCAGGELLLPAPNDCVIEQNKDTMELIPRKVRPLEFNDSEGGDWPDRMLRPVMLGSDAPDDFKPETAPAFWPMSLVANWLTGGTIDLKDHRLLKAPQTDSRDHVKLDNKMGAADEGFLFTSVGVALSALPRFGCGSRFHERNQVVTLAARVGDLPAWGTRPVSCWHPLGGERRLVHWKSANEESSWQCPPTVAKALSGARRVMMFLATPAVFRDGWRPGWVEQGNPFDERLKLKLVGVCIGRWKAVSGWAYPRGERKGGPKAIRRVVPAGGVYFFEVLDGDAGQLGKHWLHPVSDDQQDRRDGFGLAVWGTW